MPTPTQFYSTPTTMVAATAKKILDQDSNRSYLLFQNSGTGAVTISTTANPTAGLGGVTLDPASGAAGQGGSIEFADVVPTNAFYAISTAGTTLNIIEGK